MAWCPLLPTACRLSRVRRQEIVFIGAGMDETAISSQLDTALLTPDEMAKCAAFPADGTPFAAPHDEHVQFCSNVHAGSGNCIDADLYMIQLSSWVQVCGQLEGQAGSCACERCGLARRRRRRHCAGCRLMR